MTAPTSKPAEENKPIAIESGSDSTSASTPSSSSSSSETTLLEIQSTVKIAQDQQAQSAHTTISKIGDVAFTAGTQALTAKEYVNTGLASFTTVKKVLGDTENPVLSNMIQLADKLVDIGRAVPFIAPAFVILKIIIDIEQKARDADEKCQDLMERINFMVSHVLVIDKLEQVMETLKTVLQRVQDVLKDAATLIEAYRKQGKIARRLKMSNAQNFETMAGKITTCSTDLMMSLQIQQTGDLSVLKRAVPRDLVAENFIRENGGQDVINRDEALVRKFAEKMHLTMSDQVMEQMQSNMQDLLFQNQHQIEVLLRESSSTTVADTIKAVATQQREWEAERKLICVQCEKEYVVSLNGPKACWYHSAVGYEGRWRCCEKTSPCTHGYHQPEHHSKYPYSSFFLWTWKLLEFSDTFDYWANVKEMDLTTEDGAQIVRMGQLLRWISGSDQLSMPLMLINVGHVEDHLPHYFEIFDAATLEEERQRVLITGNTRIFKNAPEETTTAYSMGEWLMDMETHQFTGVKFTVKVQSSTKPSILVVPLDPKLLTMPPGKSVEYLSKSDFQVFKPDRPYEFPKTIQLGPTLRETRLREPRTFKTKSSVSHPLVLIPACEIVANNNQATARIDVERFQGLWRGLNKAPLASQNQIILLSAKAEYRLVGEAEYKPVLGFGMRANIQFPLTVGPSQTIDLPFEFLVDKPENVKGRQHLALNFAHLTIHRPLRVRIIFTDIDGETISLVQEYVHTVNGVQKREERDIGYIFVDDVDISERRIVKIKKPMTPWDKYIVGVQGGWEATASVTEVDLHKIVYNAERTGITEVDMKLGVNNNGLDWKIWALVDLSCRRVYGFKVLLYHGSMTPVRYSASLGYAPCPLYGDDGLEARPIQYAKETEIVPVIVPRDPIVVTEDDTVDDDVVPTPTPVPTPVPEPVPVSTQATSAPATDAPVPVEPAPVPSPTAAADAPASTPITPVPESVTPKEAAISTKAADVAISKEPVMAVITTSSSSPDPVQAPSTSIELLQAKVAALEARLEASERQDALMSKILALEKKLEATILATAAPPSAAAAVSSQSDRVSVLESRLASMDQKLDSMNINLRLLDGNASRLALSLEKIATILSK